MNVMKILHVIIGSLLISHVQHENLVALSEKIIQVKSLFEEESFFLINFDMKWHTFVVFAI